MSDKEEDTRINEGITVSYDLECACCGGLYVRKAKESFGSDVVKSLINGALKNDWIIIQEHGNRKNVHEHKKHLFCGQCAMTMRKALEGLESD